MNPEIKKHILNSTDAKEITSVELIQKLWNDYGELLRVHLDNGDSVILKHIKLPDQTLHPKGFNTLLSHQRKIKSYEVETNWYEHYNQTNLQDQTSPTAKLLKAFQSESGDEFFILLEDLDRLGFSHRVSEVDFSDVKTILSWLASFHAKFLQTTAQNLWPSGTYWHLETRPDELEKLDNLSLKRLAPLIDQRLKNSKYQTLVHGDAKLANFCFTPDRKKVAAVDFQYIGGGCGMKDVAYFIGSCLSEELCEKYEDEILDFYFMQLLKNITNPEINKTELENDWRKLYHVAWADFHRFLKGWSPQHWKINSYSEQITNGVVDAITDELLKAAKDACLQAGELVKSYWKKDFAVDSKKASSLASSIVTEVDHLSQKKIISILQASIDTYDLGLLAEESNDNQSRLSKDYFWAVDPLDGTLLFSEGESGFSVTTALIDKSGEVLIGVVYDPVSEKLYHAIRDRGAFCNDKPIKKITATETPSLFADRSLKDSDKFSELQKIFDIHFTGGAIMNAINALINQGCYFKYPKKETGGCAIWDLAATSLILEEAGGSMTAFNGSSLSFNKPDSLYYNQEGLMVCGSKENLSALKNFY